VVLKVSLVNSAEANTKLQPPVLTGVMHNVSVRIASKSTATNTRKIQSVSLQIYKDRYKLL